MAEEKKTKATSTTTKSAKPKVKKEKEEKLTINDIPQELVLELFKTFQQLQSQEVKATENKVEDEKKTEKPEKITKAYLRKIGDREIRVSSLAGKVKYVSPKNNTVYKWVEVGDEEVMTIDEIMNMHSKSPKYLQTVPWLKIYDEEVIEGLGLSEQYRILKELEDLDSLLEKGLDEIKNIVLQVGEKHKRQVESSIYQKVLSNEIRDVVLIRGLEDIFKTSFLI